MSLRLVHRLHMVTWASTFPIRKHYTYILDVWYVYMLYLCTIYDNYTYVINMFGFDIKCRSLGNHLCFKLSRTSDKYALKQGNTIARFLFTKY